MCKGLRWANKAIELGEPGGELTLAEAFDEMVALDIDDLFDAQASISDMARHHSQSGLSATAAALARHADDALWSRVERQVIYVTGRAATMTEVEQELSYRGAHVFGHPPTMAAHAYAALLKREPASLRWRGALFQLAVDPIGKVVDAVYEAAPIFADAAPDCPSSEQLAKIVS